MSVRRTDVVSSMITTSALAIGIPFTWTCRSAPAVCSSRITLPATSDRHWRTDTVPVPSTTSTRHTTSCRRSSRRGATAALLDDELFEEDITDVEMADALHGFADRLLERGAAFRGRELHGRPGDEHLEDG